jgi:hypothetical protein
MIEIILAAVVLGVTWLVASDGPHGAAITFVSVILSGLLAMNFFEPLALFLTDNILGSYDWQHRWDIVAFLGIFSGGVFALRALGERLLPTYAELDTLVYEIARWGFSLATGYVTMAILLTAMHVAPLPREFLGFAPERKNFFQITAPDRQWLGFTQYVSERSLKRVLPGGMVPIFDGATAPRIPEDPGTAQVWSSFPMRYAARREQFTTGTGTSQRPDAGPAPPPPPAAPRPGGGADGF